MRQKIKVPILESPQSRSYPAGYEADSPYLLGAVVMIIALLSAGLLFQSAPETFGLGPQPRPAAVTTTTPAPTVPTPVPPAVARPAAGTGAPQIAEPAVRAARVSGVPGQGPPRSDVPLLPPGPGNGVTGVPPVDALIRQTNGLINQQKKPL